MSEPERETFKDRWRKAWPILLGAFAYMIPLFWLWSQTRYPESFGIHITAHGKAALFENWWYSYLLAERHGVWDVITFLYMWAVVVWMGVWIAGVVAKDRRERAEQVRPAIKEEGDVR